MSNRGETLIAVLPSALADVLCRYCRACEYGIKRNPRECVAVKNFINQVKQRTENENQSKKTRAHRSAADKGAHR